MRAHLVFEQPLWVIGIPALVAVMMKGVRLHARTVVTAAPDAWRLSILWRISVRKSIAARSSPIVGSADGEAGLSRSGQVLQGRKGLGRDRIKRCPWRCVGAFLCDRAGRIPHTCRWRNSRVSLRGGATRQLALPRDVGATGLTAASLTSRVRDVETSRMKLRLPSVVKDRSRARACHCE